jgi:hypothetical protein
MDCHTSNESSISDLHIEVVISNYFMMLDVQWAETATVCVAENVLWEDEKYGILVRQMFIGVVECQKSLWL